MKTIRTETNRNSKTRIRYKPHYQCGEEPGSTPDVASAFINAHMDETDGMDFVAISEWAPTVEGVPPIGNPPLYGSTASVCGYGSEEYITPIVLFHRRDRWELLDSFPPADPCRDVVPLPSMSGDEAFGSCANTTTPGAEDCCVCTFSEAEYAQGAAWGQYTGQRPWVAGIYRDRRAADELGASDRTVCVVAAETPHPLWYSEILNIDGVPTNSSSFSIMRYICTYQYSPALCVPNLSETSIIFGTDVFVSGVSDFCGELPIIIAADTNAAMGDFNAALFLTTDSLRVTNTEHRLWPYTCWYVRGDSLDRSTLDPKIKK